MQVNEVERRGISAGSPAPGTETGATRLVVPECGDLAPDTAPDVVNVEPCRGMILPQRLRASGEVKGAGTVRHVHLVTAAPQRAAQPFDVDRVAAKAVPAKEAGDHADLHFAPAGRHRRTSNSRAPQLSPNSHRPCPTA